MADDLCSDGKTVESLINENSHKICENFVICEKSISADSVECGNGDFQMSETQKSGVKRNHNMTTSANQVQHNVDTELSVGVKIGGGGGISRSGNYRSSNNNSPNCDGNVVNDKINVSSGACVVQKKGGKLAAAAGGDTIVQGLRSDVDLSKAMESGQEADDGRTKKKRCSDRYDSSESSDSGVATLSCTDSSTHSSDASDPGSPYSPASLSDDVHQSLKTNMPPQTVLTTQPLQHAPQQHQKTTQHQWPWNTINNTLNNNNNNNNTNNNNFSASDKKSVNSVPISNKHKRLSVNSSDTNGTAKKVRTANALEKNQPGVPSAVKRLKATPIDESQTKITGYFKSQMKPLNALKKDFKNLVARPTDIQQTTGLDKYLNILAKVNDDKDQKSNCVKNLEVDVRTLTTMPPSLKKIERKTKAGQVAPISRKNATIQQTKSPKKHVAIAPRTNDVKKTAVASSTLRKTSAGLQVDQHKLAQSTVLLTAIRIPQPGAPQQISAVQQQSHQSSKAPSTQTKMGSLFQIPVMPNLVQIPNLLTTANGTNLVMNNGQLTRMGNAAQYFLNGTVIKLQQITASNGHNTNGTGNNGVLTVEPGLSGNILVKPSSIAQGVPLTASAAGKTSLPLSQQAPIVNQAAVNGNGCSTGQTFPTNQRLPAQSVFMATTTGLLLNATLPTVIATTASKPPGLPPTAMPALQPIQSATTQSSNILPSLSTILQAHHQVTTSSQSIPQAAQFIVSQADTILSNIPQTTLSTAALKTCTSLQLAATSMAASMQSPVPPLVTLASAHDSASTVVAASLARIKAQLNGPCEKEGKETCVTRELSAQADKLFDIKEENVQIKPADINSLFDKLKNEPPFFPGEKVKEEFKYAVKDESKPMLIKEELNPCLPSPKSFVLEQIKQKRPPDVFTNEIKRESSAGNSVDSDCTPTTDDFKSTSIETEIEEDALPKCAISPILSQPKTIRFPALPGEKGCRFGPKGASKRHDGVCYWDDCSEKYDTSSKLLDHLQTQHVNTQSGPFACLWSGCKVHGRESCSRRWLERHVLSHGGTKPFKCIVDGCGLRFGSQLALQKHVNGHFNSVESKDNTSKRTSDPPVPKQLRKNGKKLRYRRQPFSARMFDFFDSGVMEGLQHRLMVTGSMATGPKGQITFQGQVMAKRKTVEGISEVFLRWTPNEIIPDEWVPETKATLTKTVAIHKLDCYERIALQKCLRSANLNSDISTMLKQTTSITTATNECPATTSRKQSRKPPKRIQPS